MTRPTLVGTPSTAFANGANFPAPIPIPAGVVNGDYLLAAIVSQTTTATTDYTNNRGFVRVGAPYAPAVTATRVCAFYALPVPVAAAAPANVTFTAGTGAGSARANAWIGIVRGVDLANPVNVASTALFGSGSVGTTLSLAPVTATRDDCLAICEFNTQWTSPNSSAAGSPPDTWAQVAATENPSASTTVSRTGQYLYSKAQDTGSTWTIDKTWPGQSAQRSGQVIVLNGIVAPAQPMQFWLAEGGVWVPLEVWEAGP